MPIVARDAARRRQNKPAIAAFERVRRADRSGPDGSHTAI